MNDQNNINNQDPINPLDQPKTDQNPQPIQDLSNPAPVPENNFSQPQQPIVNPDPNIETPNFSQMDSSTPPPPPIPFVEEVTEEKQGTNAPNLDIPPIISNENAPKKKLGGKLIATILGIFMLVGAVSAGVILLNQQQDIREKAVGCNPGCSMGQICSNGTCIYSTPKPATPRPTAVGSASVSTPRPATPRPTAVGSASVSTPRPSSGSGCNPNCSMGQICSNGTCIYSTPRPTTSSTPTATQKSCPVGSVCAGMLASCTGDGCALKCPGGSYQTPGACNYPAVGQMLDSVCCKSGTGGTLPTIPPSTNNPSTNPPSTNPPSSPTLACLNIKPYNTSWNALTVDQLKELKVGDKVRFTVAGTTTSGSFDKARFTINSVLQPETTSKKPNTQEFYTEYTIPTGTTSFTINAEIHHTTGGWI